MMKEMVMVNLAANPVGRVQAKASPKKETTVNLENRENLENLAKAVPKLHLAQEGKVRKDVGHLQQDKEETLQVEKPGTGSATGSSATGTIEDMENSIDSKAIEEVSKTVEKTGTIEQGKNADGSPMSEQDKMAQDKNAQKEIERKRETAQKNSQRSR